MIFLIAIVAAAIASLLVISGIWWAIPILVIGVALYALRERKEGMATTTTTGSQAPEPTGMPRSSSGGPDTANERVGQSG